MASRLREAQETLRFRRETVAGVVAGLVLLLLPLMALSVLGIAESVENLSLEWSIVLVGFVIIGVDQVALFVLLGRPRRQRGA